MKKFRHRDGGKRDFLVASSTGVERMLSSLETDEDAGVDQEAQGSSGSDC